MAEEGNCCGCESGSFLICPYTLFCPVEGKLTRVEKQPTEEEDKYAPMTNQQLAEWLAKGNGQYRFRDESAEGSFWTVYEDEEDLAVDDIFIRPWGTDEWVKPTVEIYERDCK